MTSSLTLSVRSSAKSRHARVPWAVSIVAAGALAVTFGPAPAQAAPAPITAPDLAVTPNVAATVVSLHQPSVAVGSTLDSDWDAGGFYDDWDIPLTVRWTVISTVKLCAQTITQSGYEFLGGAGDPVLGADSDTMSLPIGQRSFATYSEMFDVGRGAYGFLIRATDCNGHTTASQPVYSREVFREDTAAALTYSGTWKVSRCKCSSGLATHYTKTRGSSVAFSLNSTPRDLALVMPRAADRGSADIYVDGTRKATVNTYSATARSKTVVWQMAFSDGKAHKIKIVNAGTAGHPRIDLDAYFS